MARLELCTTSAAYRRKLGRAVAMGYVRGPALTDEAILGAGYLVELNGKLEPVTVHLRAPT